MSVSKKLPEADAAKKAYEKVLTDEKAASKLELFGSDVNYHTDTLCYVIRYM